MSPALLLLSACSDSQATPTSEAPTVTSPATTSVAPTSPPEDTTQPTQPAFQMPEGKLLVYDYSSAAAAQPYSVIDFPDLTVTPYDALNTGEQIADSFWAFSPDARYLAFQRQNLDASHHVVQLFDTQTGTLTEVGDVLQSNNGPTWTADGGSLEFDGHDEGLYIYDVQSGGLRHIPVRAEFSDASAISPAGDQIVFMGGCPNDYLGQVCAIDWYLINTDGTNEHFLFEVELGAEIQDAVWNPTGQGIYYTVFGPESRGPLFYLDFATATSTLVAGESGFTSIEPSYMSPQGDLLAYVDGSYVGFVNTADNTRPLSPILGATPAWTHDGRYLVAANTDSPWTILDVVTGQSFEFDPHVSASTQIVGWLP